MSGRGPWHNNRTVAMGGMTPLGLSLLDAIAEIARAGEAMPDNHVLGCKLECSADSISRLLTVLEREGVLRIERRGRTCGLQRRVTIVATGTSTAKIGAAQVPSQPRRKPKGSVMHLVAPARAVREDARVVRTRCPMCEMPPGHPDCRHGWDGASTRAMRRDARLAVAAELEGTA